MSQCLRKRNDELENVIDQKLLIMFFHLFDTGRNGKEKGVILRQNDKYISLTLLLAQYGFFFSNQFSSINEVKMRVLFIIFKLCGRFCFELK